MPIEVKEVNGGLGVTITARGVVTDAEYLDALGKHLTTDQETLKTYRYSLSDYTAVTKVDISAEAIRVVASLCTRAAKINPDPVIAGTEFASRLSKANLFLIPLDTRGDWFRYHHLFRDLLLRELRQWATPELLAVLHERAAAWFLDDNHFEEALDHALATGDAARARPL